MDDAGFSYPLPYTLYLYFIVVWAPSFVVLFISKMSSRTFYQRQDFSPSPYSSSRGGHEADGSETDSNENLHHQSPFNIPSNRHFELLRDERKPSSPPQEYLERGKDMSQRETGTLPQAPKCVV